MKFNKAQFLLLTLTIFVLVNSSTSGSTCYAESRKEDPRESIDSREDHSSRTLKETIGRIKRTPQSQTIKTTTPLNDLMQE